MKDAWLRRHALLRSLMDRPIEIVTIVYPELSFSEGSRRRCYEGKWTWFSEDQVTPNEAYRFVCGAHAPVSEDSRVTFVIGCMQVSLNDLREDFAVRIVPPRQCYSVQIQYVDRADSGKVELYCWTVAVNEYLKMMRKT